MASSSVDLPEPFSPTKKVTGAVKVRSSCPTNGSENGNELSDGRRSVTTLSRLR